MVEQFLNHIEKHKLCEKKERVLLAVSGGIDSMVMLHLFKNTGYSVGVAHCNFLLRGNESDEDEQFVLRQSRQLGVPVYSKRFDTNTFARDQKLSVQMAARELRYSWFTEVLVEEVFDKLATAHHFNDSLETALLNWIKGGSIDGLLGIPVQNNRTIRPLLFATREDIETYAQENGIQWREDASNEADYYQRNFLRHNIMPLLKQLNPSLEKSAERGMEKLKGEHEFLNRALEELRNKFVEQAPERITIRKAAFEKLPHGASVLLRWIEHLGFNFDICQNIIHHLNDQPGKIFKGSAHDLVVDRDNLIITPRSDISHETRIDENHLNATMGQWTMELKRAGSLQIEKSEYVANPYMAAFDAGKLRFPLLWRSWQDGDVFFPLGMEHRKKISDLLIDEKVARPDKTRVTVVESGGEIIWVVGHRIDNRFKVTDKTKEVITMLVTPYFS